MAYYANLPEQKQLDIYQLIQHQVSSEAEELYQSALSKARTELQQKACAGQYKGRWFALLDGWMKGEISNLDVCECLQLGFVSEDIIVKNDSNN
ncbi:hypothetical protein [Vibrio sp. 1180_3]|uniref:hypothetical protein n=1 Tax=Vibrio sp. 1180_3 TaxID=2528832 RepID=UPI002405F674|nr:hypothetical protein [Vibrio sp. 1180_3]MDF9399068.1 hypothetical protein [Vibrio sp. 1180_3]